jgi:hypothetical protein
LLQVKTGQLVFPEYEVYITDPLFPTAKEFCRFFRASQDVQTLLAAVESREEGEEVLSLVERAEEAFRQEIASGSSARGFMEKMTTGWVLAKALTCGVEWLEKRGDHRRAVELLELLLGQTKYCRSSRGHWLERLALNLDFHLREKHKCLEVIRSAVGESGLHPAKQLSLIQRAHKILHSTSKPKNRKRKTCENLHQFSLEDFPEPSIIPAKEVLIEAIRYHSDNRPLYAIPSHEGRETFNFVSVEGLAMHHYSSAEGWPCAVHAERSTFSLMFSLLMWDIIFCPGIPNVFRTKLQVSLNSYTCIGYLLHRYVPLCSRHSTHY